MNSVSYLYDASTRDPEKLHEAVVGEELAEYVGFLMGDFSYSFNRHRELENTSHDIFERDDMDDFCGLARTLIESFGNGHVFCVLSQLCKWWRKLQSFTQENEAENDGEGEKAVI